MGAAQANLDSVGRCRWPELDCGRESNCFLNGGPDRRASRPENSAGSHRQRHAFRRALRFWLARKNACARCSGEAPRLVQSRRNALICCFLPLKNFRSRFILCQIRAKSRIIATDRQAARLAADRRVCRFCKLDFRVPARRLSGGTECTSRTSAKLMATNVQALAESGLPADAHLASTTGGDLRASDLRRKQRLTALAFTGYGPKNLGRSRELLKHPAYGSIVKESLATGSELCSAALGHRVDLAARVAANIETELEDYGEAIALVVSMELAQLRLLEEFHGIDSRKMRFSFGYSLGEVTALIASGVFEVAEVLPPLLSFAEDCVEIARDLKVGVLLIRKPASLSEIQAFCATASQEGSGSVAISAQLSPQAFLIVGQGNALECFEKRIKQALGENVRLKKGREKWPPLHTPLMYQRDISGRVAAKLASVSVGLERPDPPVLSLVSGKFSYNDGDSRELLSAWIDQPQLLADAMHEVLASGIDVLVHVGPRPEIIRTAFVKLGEGVAKKLGERSFNSLGLRAIGGLARNPSFTRFLFSRTAFLRAPLVAHVVLEDWLLEQTDF